MPRFVSFRSNLFKLFSKQFKNSNILSIFAATNEYVFQEIPLNGHHDYSPNEFGCR